MSPKEKLLSDLNFNLANDLAEMREQLHSATLHCNHPGCCCVCGHQGKCPEDGPILTGGIED